MLNNIASEEKIDPSEDDINAEVAKIMEQYKKVLNKQKGTRKVAPPGMHADYGYFLIQRGNLKDGKANLMKEVALYPESKIFIDRILKLIEE